MSVIDAFKNLFYSTYNGQDSDRDFKILLARYFPPNTTRPEITVYRRIAALIGIEISYTSCNTVDEKFKNTLIQLQANNNQNQELTDLKSELECIYNEVAKFGDFVSHEVLRNSIGITRSLAGIFDLGIMTGFPSKAAMISINGLGYIVPNDISKDQLESATAKAKNEATHYGSIFPYSKLVTIPEWEFVPVDHRDRFARELLSGIDGFLELGDKEFFGFSNLPRDRVLTCVKKIFSVYAEIPSDVLVKTLHRTLKSKVDKSILDECADVYDEYCLQVEYCLDKGNYSLAASPKLQELIKQQPPKDDDTYFSVEKKLVSALRKNGAPMDTTKFIPVMEENKADQRHVMEFATLIYREGWHYNSIYHTLDDHYDGEVGMNSQESQSVDRKRIEINHINRDSRKTRKIKRLFEHKCQICGERIQIGEDEYYSEVHHIQPLGQPHFGKDEIDNMLCVCPNHHVMLDYGIIPLDMNLHFSEINPIAKEYIEYHNKNRIRTGGLGEEKADGQNQPSAKKEAGQFIQ